MFQKTRSEEIGIFQESKCWVEVFPSSYLVTSQTLAHRKNASVSVSNGGRLSTQQMSFFHELTQFDRVNIVKLIVVNGSVLHFKTKILPLVNGKMFHIVTIIY